MRHSFHPFTAEEEDALSRGTRIEFAGTDWTHPRWLCVSCRDDEGVLMGLCAFEFKTWFDAHVTVLIMDRRCATRRALRAMFKAVFSRATRVTALIEPWNSKAIKAVTQLGFEMEGFIKNAVEGDRDALIFGMTAQTCPYLATSVTRVTLPALARSDATDVDLMDAEPSRDSGLRSGSSSDFLNLSRRKLGHLVLLAALIVGMAGPLGGVGLAGQPPDVTFVDAGADPAAMGSVRQTGGRIAIDLSAHPIVGADDPPLHVDLSIPLAVERVRPDQALIALIVEQGRQEALNDTVIFDHHGIVKEV